MAIDQNDVRALQIPGQCLCGRVVPVPSVHLCPAVPDETSGLLLFCGSFGPDPGWAGVQWIPKRLIGRFDFERRPGEQTILKLVEVGTSEELIFRIPASTELALRLVMS